MNKYTLIGILFFSSLFVHAQNEMKEINGIKSNINFLYATGTSSLSAEDAANNAKDLIALEIEQWLKENASDNITGYVAKSKENLSQIKTRRGNLYRVFVYVKKADVLPYYKEEDVMVVDFVEPQKVEKSDTSIVVLPAADVKDSIPVVANNNVYEVVDSEVTNVINPEPQYSLSIKEKKLLTLYSFSELNDYINQGRESQNIINVGNYKNLPSAGLYYIFIHNREGKIPAYIKMDNSKFINMVTGKDDAITNYKGCGAIWIQLKQE